ncbi:UDP-N-acetylmuramate--L-alanine ligase [Candidatus Parcubacteria bacterium]|nr:MAG: UDP-N-acetylmuramate--L-alanine ligase [Candidatus Parcubacteria bacterium]
MRYKSIYFIGIKGVGMASLALIAKQAGLNVGGSDVGEEFITDNILKNEKISFSEEFNKKNLDHFLEKNHKDNTLVVVTTAHGGLGNTESQYAKSLGLNLMTHGQAVGYFMKGDIFNRNDLIGISVSGCHGKTTISALVAASLSKLGLDPSYSIGTSEIFPIGPAGHYGKGKYFIAEADEYFSDIKYDKKPKFLYQEPKVLIINNIDYDHPDIYKSIEEVEEAFYNFTENLKDDSLLIINGDDTRAIKIKNKIKRNIKILTYGSSQDNDLFIDHFYQSDTASYFRVNTPQLDLGGFSLSIPGIHNAKNALAVILLLTEFGVPIKKIQDVLPYFGGTKRRLEIVGRTSNGNLVIDDYAHHPEEIKTSLSALKAVYPGKKIITIFQPHTISRTKAFLKNFALSFYTSDSLILLPVYVSMREENEQQKYLQGEVLDEFNRLNKNIIFLKNYNLVVEYIGKNLKDKNTIIVTMGAGNVNRIANTICNK